MLRGEAEPMPDPARRRLTVLLPEQLYFRLKQAVLFTRRPAADYVVLGLKHVLHHNTAVQGWPPEQFKTLADKRSFQQLVNGLGRTKHDLIPKNPAAAGSTAVTASSLARVERQKKSGSAEG